MVKTSPSKLAGADSPKSFPERFEVWLINLDPTLGSEIKKARPGVVISPNEINQNLNTIIVAPMTTKNKNYPTHIPLTFQKKEGAIVLEQLRTIDKTRLVKKMGQISHPTAKKVTQNLQELFAF